MEELVRKAPLRVPTFRGLKFTSMILAEYSQCVSLCNDAKLTILYGCDDVSSATPSLSVSFFLSLSLSLSLSLPLTHFLPVFLRFPADVHGESVRGSSQYSNAVLPHTNYVWSHMYVIPTCSSVVKISPRPCLI